MPPRVIVNADDLGLTPGVTKGIVETMTEGIVSSTTLMVNMPSAPDAVKLALQHSLPVGVHLNLTTGRPVCRPEEVPSLVGPNGSFHSHGVFTRRLLKLQISIREMEREFSAQIEAARRMGIEPTHMDTHHHLHLWLPVARVLVRVGRRCGIRKTRSTCTTDMAVPTARIPGVGAWAKRRYKTFAAALLRRWFVLPTWRMEASAFRATQGSTPGSMLDEWQRLVAHLESAPPNQVVEVSCHPGYADDQLRSYARYVERRQEEIAVLTSQQMKAALARTGIELVSFRDLSP
jgi:predicted glycoside hydrolase/deacetylase ChbG (UPF0249 family)